MPLVGNWSAEALAEAVEKCIARVNDVELAAEFEQRLNAMNPSSRSAFAEAIFDAFRDRGEASEDVAEGANASLDDIASGNADALRTLLAYTATSPGLFKEALTLFVQRDANAIDLFPQPLIDAISQRLTERASQ